MAELTLKTLPDPSKIDDKLTYTLRGVHVRTMVELLYQLWRGDNIGNSSTVKKNANGDSGFNLSTPPPNSAAPASSPANPTPKTGLQPVMDVSKHSSPMYTITTGQFGGAIPTISGVPIGTGSNIITFSPSDECVYIQCDYTYNTSTGVKAITDAEIMTATNAAFAALVSSTTGGSGTLYWRIWTVTITAPSGSGPYIMTADPLINGSLNFDICLGFNTSDGTNGPYDS